MGSTTSSLSLSISIIQLPFSRFDEVSSFKNDVALENFFTHIYCCFKINSRVFSLLKLLAFPLLFTKKEIYGRCQPQGPLLKD